MTINVTMTKEEFLEYCNYQKFKSNIKCGTIELNDKLNTLLNKLLSDGVWQDKEYEKLVNNVITISSLIGKECDNANTTIQTKSVQ